MKQSSLLTLLVAILAVTGCTSRSDPGAAQANPGTSKTPEREAGPDQSAAATSTPPAPESLEFRDGESLEETLPKEELETLHAGARALVEEFVGAFSRGDLAGAEARLISKASFEEVVAPGFRGILGSGLLAKNHEELANLIEALRGHTVESWRWKPGRLVRSKAQSAFSRPLVQITGGTIELEVDGTFIAVRLDQIVRLDTGWTIFQLHNP